MPHFRRFAATALVFMVGCGPAAPKETEILWDTWGVPHIYGKDISQLFYAFGWAQMASHGDLILRLYGQARGRAAEYWGEEYRDSDRWVRTMAVPKRAEEWYESQAPHFRRYLEAFTAGMNAYAGEHADLIADEVEAVLPVNGVDVLAHSQRAVHFTFVTNQGVVHAAHGRLAAGSNAWAIGPSRSASGNAMLLANPHLPWGDLFTFYEAQLVGPGVDAYGTTLVGFPGLGIAFNDHLGWAHTVNTYDGVDLYELTLADGGYKFDGETRAFDERKDTLKIKRPDGTEQEEEWTVRQSVHGPVVAEGDGRAFALRVAGLDAPGMLEQWWDMAQARNLGEFESALAQLQVPMFTVMYADRDGHIMHLFGGRVPVRTTGDWDYWSGVVRGDTSGTLWTKIHPYRDLPRVVDPPSGWLQNANDPPWTTTFPPALHPEDFPPYMAARSMSFRPQRSARMLAEDDRITFDELLEYKHSTRMELADRILDDLLPAAREHGGSLVQRAAAVLEQWDRRADAESRGAVLFVEWTREARIDGGFATPWSATQPRATPDGLNNPRHAVRALERAARSVERDYGALDVPWGDVYRLRMKGRDLPANGGSGYPFGIFRVTDYREAEDGRFVAASGDTYVAAIEFGNPVRAKVLLSYGNATQPHSPHVGDQLELFARKELRDVWRTREAIMAHLESRQLLNPPKP